MSTVATPAGPAGYNCRREHGQPPVSTLEDARLRALGSFNILDTAPEDDLDELVTLITRICATPIGVVTFVDAHRQWFKARVGLQVTETSRLIAFCATTIQQDHALVVEDALRDPRFADNPLVLGSPHLRFYAGWPLVTPDGYAIGTLAVMDTVPRQLTALQLDALRVLANQLGRWLELRRTVRQLVVTRNDRDSARHELEAAKARLERRVEEQGVLLDVTLAQQGTTQQMYRTLWETTTDAVLIIVAGGTIRFANPSVLPMFQHRPEGLVGQRLELLVPERFRAAHASAMATYLRTGQRTFDWRAMRIAAARKDGSEVAVEIAFSEMRMGGDTLFVGFFRDVSEQQRTQDAMFEEKQRAQATLLSIGDGVIVTDDAGRVTFMNPLASELTGWELEDAIGQPQDAVFRCVDATGRAHGREDSWNARVPSPSRWPPSPPCSSGATAPCWASKATSRVCRARRAPRPVQSSRFAT